MAYHAVVLAIQIANLNMGQVFAIIAQELQMAIIIQ
jgi:hypothetical protein